MTEAQPSTTPNHMDVQCHVVDDDSGTLDSLPHPPPRPRIPTDPEARRLRDEFTNPGRKRYALF